MKKSIKPIRRQQESMLRMTTGSSITLVSARNERRLAKKLAKKQRS